MNLIQSLAAAVRAAFAQQMARLQLGIPATFQFTSVEVHTNPRRNAERRAMKAAGGRRQYLKKAKKARRDWARL